MAEEEKLMGTVEQEELTYIKSLNIYQRLAEVRAGIDYIQKDKKVQGYMAVTHDAVTAYTRPLFSKYRILTLQDLTGGQVVATGTQTSSGTPIIRYEATYAVGFVNIDSPEDRIVISVGAHANDTGDKAPGKAMSYAKKYAILKTLDIETGEADEGRVTGEPEKLKPEQILALHSMLTDVDIPADETLQQMARKAFGVESIEEVEERNFEHAKQMLEIKIKKVADAAAES